MMGFGTQGNTMGVITRRYESLQFQKTFAVSIAAFIVVLLPLFCVFVRYGTFDFSAYYGHVGQYYRWFLDIELMVFVGFGFLMTFLRHYSYSAVGLNYMLSGIIMLEALLVVGMFQQVVWGDHSKILVELPLLIDATICAAGGMIFFGAVLGKASPTQLVWLAVWYVPLYAVNQHLVFKTLGALDVGGSISVHAFGAYYGLAAGYIISRRQQLPGSSHPLNAPSYASNVMAMIGTLFLWIYWPSFNGALASVNVHEGDDHSEGVPSVAHRNQFFIIINTVISLLGAIVSTFATSALTEKKISMVHVQNATLAGGVIMGSAANLNLNPGGALAMGLAAGVISTLGFAHLSPLLERKIGLTDTCGVHNLHGIPGWLGGVIAGIAAWGQNEDLLEHGGAQLGYQILAVLVTLGIACAGGVLGGLLVTFLNLAPVIESSRLYNDEEYWVDAEGGFPELQCHPCVSADASCTDRKANGKSTSRDPTVHDGNLDRDSSYHGAYRFYDGQTTGQTVQMTGQSGQTAGQTGQKDGSSSGVPVADVCGGGQIP